MKTIGIDYTAAVHQTAGIGRYTREMVAALAQQPLQVSYRLFVADAGRRLNLPLPGENFSWRPSRHSERRLARMWFRLRLPLTVERWTGPLDLFHAPDFILPPTEPNTRTIVTIHDLSFVRLPETTMPGMERHLNTWVPRSVEKADHVIAVSEATKRDLVELYQTPPEKISVMYHGVTPAFRPVADAAQLTAVRQKYGLGDQPLIVSVGTLQPRKNYRRLVQAFAQLATDSVLVIAGSKGWRTTSIFAEVEKLGLAGRVIFPGFVADEDLPALYGAATFFVYPSLYEGFGLPVLEAMACGTPVISSNAASLPEVVGEAGLQVDPLDVDALASAMRRLLADATLRHTLAEAGLIQAAKFSWQELGQRLAALYEHLLMIEPGEV